MHFFEMGVEPSRVISSPASGAPAKVRPISLGGSHGFNAVHGRMPSVGTGALLANRQLTAIGIRGDGDTAPSGRAVHPSDAMYLTLNSGDARANAASACDAAQFHLPVDGRGAHIKCGAETAKASTLLT